jgi:hypothetical protein
VLNQTEQAGRWVTLKAQARQSEWLFAKPQKKF